MPITTMVDEIEGGFQPLGSVAAIASILSALVTGWATYEGIEMQKDLAEEKKESAELQQQALRQQMARKQEEWEMYKTMEEQAWETQLAQAKAPPPKEEYPPWMVPAAIGGGVLLLVLLLR